MNKGVNETKGSVGDCGKLHMEHMFHLKEYLATVPTNWLLL